MTFNSIPCRRTHTRNNAPSPSPRRKQSKFRFSHSGTCLAVYKHKFSRRYAMRVAKITIYIFFLAVLFLVIRMPEPIHAQETPNRQAATVDDGKLRSFAKVYVQVEK